MVKIIFFGAVMFPATLISGGWPARGTVVIDHASGTLVCVPHKALSHYFYGIVELSTRFNGLYSQCGTIVQNSQREYSLSNKFFKSATTRFLESRIRYWLFYCGARSVSSLPILDPDEMRKRCARIFSFMFEIDGEDAIIVRHSAVTNEQKIIGRIDSGAEFADIFSAANGSSQLPHATSFWAFPDISWDAVVYAYGAPLLARYARDIISQPSTTPHRILHATGCGIGFERVAH